MIYLLLALLVVTIICVMVTVDMHNQTKKYDRRNEPDSN